jgi:hypothetical protein
MVSIPELLGGWLGGAKDAEGNRCEQDKVYGADNIKYAESIRTMFIDEGTSRRNNNYVWAFNIDTRKLSRILSVPMYAEVTGLRVVESYDGFAYIMSNFQHPGEEAQKGEFLGDGTITEADVLNAIDTKWDERIPNELRSGVKELEGECPIGLPKGTSAARIPRQCITGPESLPTPDGRLARSSASPSSIFSPNRCSLPARQLSHFRFTGFYLSASFAAFGEQIFPKRLYRTANSFQILFKGVAEPFFDSCAFNPSLTLA